LCIINGAFAFYNDILVNIQKVREERKPKSDEEDVIIIPRFGKATSYTNTISVGDVQFTIDD
jgi:hypothetical protein